MSLFVMSDLHLSTNEKTNKSMEVFGSRWIDYIPKIQKNWNLLVSDSDTVVIPGDVSWAMNLEDAISDLKYINSLNGKKLIGKGNHDFWWNTSKKMQDFFGFHSLDTLSILYNNAYIVEDRIVCGSRGWFPDESKQTAVNNADYEKIINRECIRLKMSLDTAQKLQKDHENTCGVKLPLVVFLHFPPIWNDFVMRDIIDVLHTYNIDTCYYGHIHNSYNCPSSFEFENIKFVITSSDFLNFYPLRI